MYWGCQLDFTECHLWCWLASLQNWRWILLLSKIGGGWNEKRSVDTSSKGLNSKVCETAKKTIKRLKNQTNKQTIKGQSVTQAEAPPGGSPLSSSNWEGEWGRGKRSSYIQRRDYPQTLLTTHCLAQTSSSCLSAQESITLFSTTHE